MDQRRQNQIQQKGQIPSHRRRRRIHRRSHTSLIIIWHYTSANSALHATIQWHFRALKQNTQRYGTNNAHSFKSTAILLVRSSPACCLYQESSSTFSPQLQYSILIM